MSILEQFFEEYQQLKTLVSEFEKTNQELQTELDNALTSKSEFNLTALQERLSELEQENQSLKQELAEQKNLLAEKDKEIALLKSKLTATTQPPVAKTENPPSSPPAESRASSSSEAINLMENSGLFDKNWYLQHYPDVAKSGMNPAEHYLLFGAAEMRNPSANFNTAAYLRQHPELLRSKLNPLVHYLNQRPQKV
ncbi:MAG: hypothetical protein KC422_12485 [Trueperaceae bacterium]|nr:hypothetical protein [Trueperaceae bacterium]